MSDGCLRMWMPAVQQLLQATTTHSQLLPPSTVKAAMSALDGPEAIEEFASTGCIFSPM